jgi:hypothetical protein
MRVSKARSRSCDILTLTEEGDTGGIRPVQRVSVFGKVFSTAHELAHAF